MKKYQLVILESPYAGDCAHGHHRYLQAAIRDCLARGEAPFASHQMYTSALDDHVPEQRTTGIQAGFAWRAQAAYTVVYQDLGISSGMAAGIKHATAQGHTIEYRNLVEFRPE